jgi:hypothetical protein
MFEKLFKRKESRSFDLTPEQDEYLAGAIDEYNNSLKTVNEHYGFSDYDEWGYDQYSGKFQLKKDGSIIIEANAQIIGSYDEIEKDWEWSWNNPNVEDSAKADSFLVKEYGDSENIWYFKEGIVPVLRDEQAIYFAAVGKKLTSSQAIFPGDSGNLTVYLLLKNITVKNG